MRISFDNLVIRGTAGLVAIYDALQKTTWAFDLKGALDSLKQQIDDNDTLSSFVVEPDGNGGYNLTITTANQTFVQNIPAATISNDGIMTKEMAQLLLSLKVKDIQQTGPDTYTVYFVDGTTLEIAAGGGGGAELNFVDITPYTLTNIRTGESQNILLSLLPADPAGYPVGTIVYCRHDGNASPPIYGIMGYVQSNDGSSIVVMTLACSRFVDQTGDTMTGDLTSMDCALRQENAATSNAGLIYGQRHENAEDGGGFTAQWIECAGQVIQATGNGNVTLSDSDDIPYNPDFPVFMNSGNFQVTTTRVDPYISVANFQPSFSGAQNILRLSIDGTSALSRVSWYPVNPVDMSQGFFVGDDIEVSSVFDILFRSNNSNTNIYMRVTVKFGVEFTDGTDVELWEDFYLVNRNSVTHEAVPKSRSLADALGYSPKGKTISAFYTEFLGDQYQNRSQIYFRSIDLKGYGYNISDGNPGGGEGGSPNADKGYVQTLDNFLGNKRVKAFDGDIDMLTPNGFTVIDRYMLSHPSVLEYEVVYGSESETLDLADIEKPMVFIDASDNDCGSNIPTNDFKIIHSMIANEIVGRFWEFRCIRDHIHINGNRKDNKKARNFRIDVVLDKNGTKALSFSHYSTVPIESLHSITTVPPTPPTQDVTIQIFQPTAGVITVTDQNGNNVPDGTTIPNDGSVTLTFAWAAGSNASQFVMWQGSLNMVTINPYILNIKNELSSVFQVAALVESVILINNNTDMNNFSQAIRTNSVVGGIDGTNGGAGRIYRLNTNSINIYGLQPIGNAQNPFKGTFDGNNYGIFIGMEYDYDDDYIGLFGHAKEALIKNVFIWSSYIHMKNQSISSNYVGAVCGMADSRTIITNCRVTDTNILGRIYCAGAVCGELRGGSEIRNCVTLTCIVGNNYQYQSNPVMSEKCGGIVGRLYGTSTSKPTRVLNCWTSSFVSGIESVGGIAGHIDCSNNQPAELKDCLAMNQAIVLVSNTYTDVGKIWGYMTGPGTTSGNLSNNGIEYRNGVPFQGGPKDGTNITRAAINSDPTVGGRFAADNGFVEAAPNSNLISSIIQADGIPYWVT